MDLGKPIFEWLSDLPHFLKSYPVIKGVVESLCRISTKMGQKSLDFEILKAAGKGASERSVK